ncbi:ABC transporter ATP-binding protein [Actinomyces lilanjuaniae]|uniref:ABC transporter ATP-binding protein n=1 Tax=Actinomyces lilanjuaniae TaxID=2321394 RepID=A0ABN5PT50_9ACTO|nr:ABC transporter ATP-binding protein [Actinomyces lilanjuaniae]AYD90394.1 ABC transporter ATP-binding protein [Actinomyces lilanjuaniae]
MTTWLSTRLSAQEVTIAYDGYTVSADLDVEVPVGGFTAVVGPNACGKSTLLRCLARLHRPSHGTVLLDGEDIYRLDTRTVARKVGLLPQSALVPDRMSVRDLVARGRFPHQGMFRQWSQADRDAVDGAMTLTGVQDLALRPVDQLSGGQRQRVWLALVLAQDTETVLLDEPTTFLDLAHQVEILRLCRALNEEQGRTVVAVLHDLNHAARCASHMIVMRDGQVYATGSPGDIVTEQMVGEVFGLDAVVMADPVAGMPMVVPATWGGRPRP